jgi:Uncharacterized protein conserved in bacteria
MKTCYCHSGEYVSNCCEPFISGKTVPKTALQLMRSRYSAYTLNKIDYIKSTMTGPALHKFHLTNREQKTDSIQWTGLTILSHSEKIDNGWVTFIANYIHNDLPQQLHEKSLFKKVNNKWFYYDGELLDNR